ncbi:opticin isoform X2 [Nycticebus coucang]|uniref:opticin isoform X2 n=1 Tax=Nycticebus coucang TaxID=9470 RepID=UPI00234D870E|nr:opticin isoform X2 [Nycticebus coucang]
MRLLSLMALVALVAVEAESASLPKEERKRREEQRPREGDSYAPLPMENYVLSPENYGEVFDLSNYEQFTDYGDQLPEVKVTSLAPSTRISPTKSSTAPRLPSASPLMTRPTTLGLPGSLANHGLPTCLVCVCLGSSVYCDDIDLEDLPPLPQTTVYLYARFNRIRHIMAGDFEGLTKLKRIDLSSNSISSIDNNAFSKLPALRDLILPGNQLAALPVLPRGIEFLDVRLNRLQSSGIQRDTFRNNRIETMQRDTFCDPEEHRYTRRLLEDIRLDGHLGPASVTFSSSCLLCLLAGLPPWSPTACMEVSTLREDGCFFLQASMFPFSPWGDKEAKVPLSSVSLQ